MTYNESELFKDAVANAANDEDFSLDDSSFEEDDFEVSLSKRGKAKKKHEFNRVALSYLRSVMSSFGVSRTTELAKIMNEFTKSDIYSEVFIENLCFEIIYHYALKPNDPSAEKLPSEADALTLSERLNRLKFPSLSKHYGKSMFSALSKPQTNVVHRLILSGKCKVPYDLRALQSIERSEGLQALSIFVQRKKMGGEACQKRGNFLRMERGRRLEAATRTV